MGLNKYKRYMEDDFDLDEFKNEARNVTRHKQTEEKNRKIIKTSSFIIVIISFFAAYLLYSILDYIIYTFFMF